LKGLSRAEMALTLDDRSEHKIQLHTLEILNYKSLR